MKKAATRKQPFFLYRVYNAPHTPLEAKEEDLLEYEEIEDEKRGTYAAMVYAVDRGVGRIVNALQDVQAFENTLIVFLSDNGGKIGAGADNGALSGGKGSVTEGGFRVPMMFHWPAQIASGTIYQHPVTALDYYPTFSRLAGANVPQDQQLDGVDIWNALKNNKSP